MLRPHPARSLLRAVPRLVRASIPAIPAEAETRPGADDILRRDGVLRHVEMSFSLARFSHQRVPC